MDFYCVIQNCDVSKINDYASFRAALPLELHFYTTKTEAIDQAKIVATNQANESYVIYIKLNQLLIKRLLAQVGGSSISETFMPEHKVDHWKIEKLTFDAKNLSWQLQNVKERKRDYPAIANNSFRRISQPLSHPISAGIWGSALGLALGLAFSLPLLLSITSSLLLGTLSYSIIHAFQNHLQRECTSISTDEKNSSVYQDGFQASRNWTAYFKSYKNLENWKHPLTFRTAMEAGYKDMKDEPRNRP